MPSLELRPAKLAKIKDRDECVLRIEAAPNDATRILDELGSATSKRFRGKWVTQVSGGIERLCRSGVGAAVADLTLPDDHGIETSGKPSVAAPRVPHLILSGADTEEMVSQAILLEARNYLLNYHAGGCRLRQRYAQ
jgi:two-component system cell cycle response regulator